MPDARIVIAGRGEPLDRYRALIKSPESVELRGYHVPKDERDDLFARASVVVLPYVFATTSAVIPIARLHRRPVVVTDVGGLPDAVEHGVDGLIVPPADPAALADAVAGLLEDPERARAMGEAGRRRQDAASSPDVIAPETIAVYERAIAARTHSLRSSKILASLSR